MEKLNIAEILKDCPSGMELDCAMFENIEFDGVVDNPHLPIRCRILNPDGKGYNVYNFTQYGCWNSIESAKCVIFPKGKTTWEGFVPPCKFKDGDIITMENECGIHVFIYNYTTNEYNSYGYHAIFTSRDRFKINGFCSGNTYRFASEEEKQKLFNAIKANGYKWNAETKTLEKLIEPKFKVGDRIKDKNNRVWFVVQVSDKHFDISSVPNAKGYFVPIEDQDDYELVPNKFDITTLKAFDKVLVRQDNNVWECEFFSSYNSNDCHKFHCIGGWYEQCIPYNDKTKHLLGTTNNCDEYYKTWE